MCLFPGLFPNDDGHCGNLTLIMRGLCNTTCNVSINHSNQHFIEWKSVCDFLYISTYECGLYLSLLLSISENVTFDLWPRTKVKGHFPKRKPICDFLYVYNTKRSLSHWFWDTCICENKIFDLWPLTLDQGQRSFHQTKAYIWFSLCPLHKYSLYLSLFPIYLWNSICDLLSRTKI